MNKIAKAAIAAAACILLVLAGVRIVRLNQRYPAAETVIYTPGQEAPYGNFSLTVTGSRFLEENEIASLFAQELQEGLDIKCLVLDFQVKNNGSQTEQIDIYNFILESQAWKNGINLAAFMVLNQENTKASLSPLLEPGESMTMKLPFHMLSGQYRPSQWTQVEQRDYLLTYSLYPVKQSIACGD
jgi:hypothetical protein